MKPTRFRIGYPGLEAQDALCIIATWIESRGAEVEIDEHGFTPAAKIYNRLCDKFGKGQYRLNGIRLEFQEGRNWVEALHADDIAAFVDGVEMEIVTSEEEGD